jgi:Ca-activated chloride channel family protein
MSVTTGNHGIRSIRPELYFLCVLLLLIYEGVCWGGGILHVRPPVIGEGTVAVARPVCQVSKTLVTVSESYVEFKTNQVFINDNDYPLDAMFVFPLPGGKSTTVTEALVDGNKEGFNIVEAEELFPLLKKITIETEDPASIAIANGPAIVINRTRLNIRESKSFHISYRVPTKIRDSALDITVNMVGERYALAPIGEFEILVRFKMSRPVRTSISPSHRITVFKESDQRQLVSVKEKEIRRPSDLRLLTSLGGSGLDMKLFFHPSTKSGGYFLAMIEPPLSNIDNRRPPLDLAMLLDYSGSIGPEQLTLGKKVILLFLEKLRPVDRFDIIKLTSKQRRLFGIPVKAEPQRISSGVGFLEELDNGDGTDLYNGILSGLETLSSKKRISLMILISDGKSTIGKTGGEALVEMIKRYNKNRTRIFVLALGNSPDLTTLSHIAKTTGGAVLRSNESKDFGEAITRWISSIIAPRVVDLAVDLKDLDPELVVPDPIPEILGQDSAIITGRYGKVSGREVSLSVKGKIDGHNVSDMKKMEVSTQGSFYHFIPPLWAMRRMANLLDLQRTRGQDHSLVEKIQDLAETFGFEICDHSPGSEQAFSQLLWKYKTSYIPEDVTRPDYKRIGNRLFRQMHGYWSETGLKSDGPERELVFLSKEYFDLIRLNAELAPIVAIGPEVKFQNKDQIVKIIHSAVQENHEGPKIDTKDWLDDRGTHDK